MVANSVVGGKSLLRTSTKGFIMHAENDLKILTFYHHPMPKPPLFICKYKAQEIKLTYLIFVFDVDPFSAWSSLTATLLPMLTCIHKDKQRTPHAFDL
jgi:hypothetical protein